VRITENSRGQFQPSSGSVSESVTVDCAAFSSQTDTSSEGKVMNRAASRAPLPHQLHALLGDSRML